MRKTNNTTDPARMRKRHRLSVALLAACMALTACTGSSSPTTTVDTGSPTTTTAPTSPTSSTPAEASGSITYVQATYGDGLDPHTARGGQNNVFHFNMFEGLYDVDQESRIVLSLASDHEVSADGLTHTFVIREGVKFHNGETLTAEDVAFSLNRARDREAEPIRTYADDLSTIESVEAVDDKTVEVRLNAPDPILPNRLTHQAGRIVPKAYVEEVGDEGFNSHPIGTGPYAFVEAEEGSYTIMEAFPEYWRGVANIATVRVEAVAEASSRIALLRTGEADVIGDLDVTQVDQIEAAGFEVAAFPTGEVQYIAFQGQFEPFADVRVRTAITMVIDRAGIIDGILLGKGTPLSSLMSPSLYGEDPDLEPHPYDPDAARALLAEAGFDMSTPFEFALPRARYPKAEEAGQVIAANLRDFGFNVTLNLIEYDTWLSHLREGTNPPLMMSGMSARLLDPATEISRLFSCDGALSSWCDPTLDTMMIDDQADVPFEDRVDSFRTVTHYMHENPPAIYLWDITGVYGLAPEISWTPRQGTRVVYFYQMALDQ